VTVKETALENPLMAVIVIVEFLDEPGDIVRLKGLALIEKSGAVGCRTLTVTVTE
jgi:hypothetical protein